MENDSIFFNECVNKTEECKRINEKLKTMYAAWFAVNDEFFKTSEAQDGNDAKSTAPFRITCTDAYLNHRIIIIGKEARCKNGKWTVNSLKRYLSGSHEEYEYEDGILNGKNRNTEYLKVRKIASGCEENAIGEKCKGLAALVNNLNKVSDDGRFTIANWELSKKLYEPFKVNNDSANLSVFEYEFKILEPKVIIVFCGKNYDEQVIRCFGDNSDNKAKIRKAISELSVKGETISDALTLTVKNGYGNSEYKVYLTIHPSAHMTKEIRKEYKERVKEIVTNK